MSSATTSVAERSLAVAPARLELRVSHPGATTPPRDAGADVERRIARDMCWLRAVGNGLRQTPLLIEAVQDGRRVGALALVVQRNLLFGPFLIALPYVNSGGVQAADDEVASRLIDRAVELADEHHCRYLELRHEQPWVHHRLMKTMAGKVHMRLKLPASSDSLWESLKSSVRNQVRKGQREGFSVSWGRDELLDDFYRVFARNMRDLGTPVYGRRLFRAILSEFGAQAEFCCVRDGSRPAAAALLVHEHAATQVPSASSIREYNSRNANMLMYWNLLSRAVERGQPMFDFGRCTEDGPHYRFKKQWGAQPHPAVWQYYDPTGSVGSMRPENARYSRRIAVWRRLPVWLTRLIGPPIVRGIP